MTDEPNVTGQDANKTTSSGDAKPTTTNTVANYTPEQLGKLKEEIFRRGTNEVNARWRESIKEIFPDAEGIDDLTPSQLKELFKQGEPTPKKKSSETETEYKERLKLEQEKSSKYKSEAEGYKEQLSQMETRQLIEKSIPENVVKHTAVAKYFLAEYSVKKLSDGSIKVYDSGGEVVRDAEYNVATVEYAVNKFLTDNPYLFKTSAKSGSGINDMMGMPPGAKAEHQKNLSNAEKLTMAENLLSGKSSLI